MLNVLAALLMSRGVLMHQAPALTPTDVQAIEAAVVEELVPADGSLGKRTTKGRVLLIDQDQMTAVMQRVAAAPLPAGLAIARAFQTSGRDAAIQCARPPRGDCRVTNDGIYMTLSDAAFVASTGELRVHAAVVWTHVFAGQHDLNGYEVDLFFARSGSGWRLTHRGTYIVG